MSETDFVELPEGDLLCINNSIFGNPGRQRIYRSDKTWTPGPLEKVRYGRVPETVALTEAGLLVGCLRANYYAWSDDHGLTWYPLAGIPEMGPEVYQPWIHYLGDNRFACAGHYGHDDAIGKVDQHLTIHFFTVDVVSKTKDTKLEVVREYDETRDKWINTYRVRLTCGGAPLADREIDLWYVDRNQPGYDSWNTNPIEERMKKGGTTERATTDRDGNARVSLPRFDAIEDLHHSYQFVVRFNMDRRYPELKPAQSPLFEFYANHYQDPVLG